MINESIYFSSNELTPVDYQMSFNGADPDGFFTAEPSLDQIADAIEDATGGEVTLCTEGCVPTSCNTVMLEVSFAGTIAQISKQCLLEHER